MSIHLITQLLQKELIREVCFRIKYLPVYLVGK